VRMRWNRGLAAVAVAGCALTVLNVAVAPSVALALTSGTGGDTFTVTGGSLGLASVGTAAFAVTLSSGTVTTAATNLNSGNYSDTTGSGAGWNGTIALQQFVNTQAWVPTGTALSSTASGGYTGNTVDANYQVAVTSDGGTTVAVTWTGTESGSGTATKGSAFAVGTKGITITFANANTYLASDRYNIKADVLATTAMVMATGGSCVATGTTATGTNIPVMTNTSSTVTGGTYNTYGTAVKIITVPVGQGLGTFTCTPKSTLSVDSNSAIPGSYTASAQFTIATGP
jgi:hypothetical protein